MAEWSNAPDSKSGIRFIRIGGSNPPLSASDMHKPRAGIAQTRGLFYGEPLFATGNQFVEVPKQ